MALWAKGFKSLYPDVTIAVEATGSATAPPALVQGAAQFGPMSRPMTAEELEAFEKKYGYRVSSFRVAVDALAVYVNKDNPIQCLTHQVGPGSAGKRSPRSAVGDPAPIARRLCDRRRIHTVGARDYQPVSRHNADAQ
jgi:hypothetical protein